METAEKLNHLCLSDEEVGRLGGDEFVIFIKDVKDKNSIENLALKIINKLEETYKTPLEEIKVTASIGISINDENNHTFSNLYHRADKALYDSKYRGKNTYTFFNNQ